MNRLKSAAVMADDPQDWFAYVRVSSDEQKEKQTIETQRRQIEQAGLVNPDHISGDDGVSGTVPFIERPGGKALLAKMRDHAKTGRTPKLLLNYLDRLGRDGRDTVNTALDMMEQGFGLRTIFEGDFENTPEGRLKAMLYSGMAESGRFRILKGMGDGMRRVAAEGGWLGGRFVPYGYRVRDGRLTPSTEPISGSRLSEVQVVQRIFEQAAGGRSCQVIADDLNRLSVPPPGIAKRWMRSRVRDLLRQSTYRGSHVWGKRKSVKVDGNTRLLPSGRPRKMKYRLEVTPTEARITRACPALVTEEVWKQARAEVAKNQIQAMAHPKNQYLLTGLVRCGVCGHGYIGHGVTRPSGKIEFYYHRHGGDRDLPKSHVCASVRGADLEKGIWGQIEVFLSKPGAVIRELERQMGSAEDTAQRMQQEKCRLEDALSRKAGERDRVNRRYFQGQLDEAELNKYLREIERDKVSLEQALAEARQASEDREADVRALNNAGTLLGSLRSRLDKEPPFAVRRQIVAALVLGVTVFPGQKGQQAQAKVQYAFLPAHERAEQFWASKPPEVKLFPAPVAALPSSASATPPTKPTIAPPARPTANFWPTGPFPGFCAKIGRAPSTSSKPSKAVDRRLRRSLPLLLHRRARITGRHLL